jgi:hypothetical protein
LHEAKTLFNNVREPTLIEEQLGECIDFVSRDESETSIVEILNKPEMQVATQERQKESENEPVRIHREGAEGERPRGKTNNAPSRETPSGPAEYVAAPPTG